MEIELPQVGGCQCGAVRYEVTGLPLALYACHCTECQRQSGSAFGLSMIVAAGDFHLTGALKHFARDGGGETEVHGHFCPECGTRIYHSRPGRRDRYTLKPGTLDDTTWLRPSAAIWLRSAQGWAPIPDGWKTFPGQPEEFSDLRLRS